MGKAITTTGFDYSSLGKELRGKLIQLAGRIRRHSEGHLDHALKIGEDLHSANEEMGRSGCESAFGSWVKHEFGISRQTAYNYMNAYVRFGGDSHTAGQFTMGALYLLSTDSVPSEAVDVAINLAQKGERITKDKASELKRKYMSNGHKRTSHGISDGADAGDQGGDQPANERVAATGEGDAADNRPDRGADDGTGKLFERGERLFKELTQLFQEIQIAKPYRDREAIQVALNMTFENFRKWKRS